MTPPAPPPHARGPTPDLSTTAPWSLEEKVSWAPLAPWKCPPPPLPPGRHWKGAQVPPLRGVQPVPGHRLPDANCQLQRHL